MTLCGINYGQISYKGIPFEMVSTRYIMPGQEVITHDYPLTEFFFNERVIPKTPFRLEVTGILRGYGPYDFRQVWEEVERVWGDQSPGILQEPYRQRGFNVILTEPVSFNWQAGQLQQVQFSAKFIENNEAIYPRRSGFGFSSPDRAVREYTTFSSAYYLERTSGPESFSSVLAGYNAAQSYMSLVSRLTPGSGMNNVTRSINDSSVSRDYSSNPEIVEGIFEDAAEADAPLSFYQQAVDTRVDGDSVESAQGDLFALTALSYYYENISDGAPLAEIEDFQTRAEALKDSIDDPDMQQAIEELVLASVEIPTSSTYSFEDRPGHALVESYRAFGSVDQAYEITVASGGVSGARLPRVVIP